MSLDLSEENPQGKSFGLRAPVTPHVPGLGLEQSRRTPVCPRCHRPLEPLKHETGIAWRCAGCGGQSLNFSQFRRMIPEHHAREIWLTAMEHPQQPRRRVDCPECRQEMGAVMIPFQEREIELDLCLTCQRLWLEPSEDRPFRLERDFGGLHEAGAFRRREVENGQGGKDKKGEHGQARQNAGSAHDLCLHLAGGSGRPVLPL